MYLGSAIVLCMAGRLGLPAEAGAAISADLTVTAGMVLYGEQVIEQIGTVAAAVDDDLNTGDDAWCLGREH